MKKLMTALLCAVGFSLVSQAEKISGTNFEALEVDANVVDKTDAGQEGQGYWSGEGVDALIATNTFTAVEVEPPEGEPYIEYVPNITPYSGTVGFPTVHDEAQTSEKFLSINTKGGELVRNIQEGGTPQSIGEKGIYFDSMVQFTATDALDASAGNESDKLILWLRDNGDGTTNLVVTAGKLGPTGNATSFDYIITNEVQADKWYRLTIQAIANAVNDGDNAYTCYAIYIDGVKAEYSVSDVAFDGEGARTFTVQAPYSGYLYNGSVHALFPNLLGKSNEATNFTAVAFSGVGAVDDIEFTRTAPDFANPPASLTVEWTVGVDTVTITPGEGEAIVIAANGVNGSTNITDKGTYTIAATVQTGYVAATVSQSEVTVANTEVKVKVETEEGYAEINGTLYASLADAITAAQNGDTVKLYKGKDLGSAPLAIDSQNAFVLDLNGQLLSGGNKDGVLSVGNALTIIDSIGGGAVSNTTDEAEAVAVIVDGGSLVIGYPENDMGASFFGSVGAANDVETISIVRGNFYGFGEISPAGYVADGSVGNMVENCYVVAPDTNTYVAQIGGNKYTTLADAIAAAQNDDTVTLLDDITLTVYETIPQGKSLTIDLNGNTITATGPAAFYNMGTLTLQNGTIDATYLVVANAGTLTVVSGVYDSETSLAFSNASNGTAITIQGGTISAQEMCVLTAVASGTVTVTGGTLTSRDNAVIADNGTAGKSGNTITVTGGTLNGGITTAGYVACGIYLANNDTLTFGGTATMNITGGVGILARAGDVTITGGTINTTGNAVGKVGDSRVVVPCSAVVFDTSANYPGYDVATAEATISGGTFTSEVDAIAWVKDNGDVNAIAVSGGAFSSAVADEFCANGFIPVTEPNAQGKYEVEAGWKITFVNDDDTLIYATNVQANATVEYLGETPTKAADESYTYTFNGWTPTIVSPAVADATYTATYTATPVTPAAPVVDGETVVPGEEFDTATTEKPITYPSTPTVTGEVGNQTITYGTSGSVKVPEYYTASAEGNVVSLALNDNALATIGDATVAEEAKQAIEIGGETVGVTLTTTNTKLYYGVKTCSTPDGTFTLQGTPQQGTGSAMQLSVTRGENETAKFYRLYVTDVAPAQSGN